MKIETGLFDRMVLQRNRRNVSEQVFTGSCGASGPVTATVKKGNKTLPGFAAAKAGAAARGRFKGVLKGLPVGGPYDIELRAGDETVSARDVLVGDVWLLGGQSNMQGCGLFPKTIMPADPLVRAFFMDDRWAVAKDPVHNMWACVDPVHIDLCGGSRPPKAAPGWGVCPGPAFGLDMLARTGIPQGLIACAHGGTSMTQWDPKRKAEGGKSLYGALVRRLVKNGGRVAGLIWYQGCSDANPEAAPLYTARMKELVAALRRDCRDKTLPVVIVQIARVVNWSPQTMVHWNSVQEQERLLPKAIRNLLTVPAIDLPLDDSIHISGEGQWVLGARLAQAMQVLRGDRKAGPAPIALKSVSIGNERGWGVVTVDYANVAGALRSASRPAGFTVALPTGPVQPFKTQLAGSTVRLHCAVSALDLEQASLHYGFGTDPYCNITDGAGRSLPVMGPLRLGQPRAITPFVQELRVSAWQPGAGDLKGLSFPKSLDPLGLKTRRFPGAFCDLHEEIGTHGGRDEVVYYACRFTCPESMRLSLVLGYDGPLKAWMDGRPVFHDPKGVNPATTDKAKVPYRAAKGEHEVVLALGTNHGRAWGIHLRFERVDLPARLLAKGPEAYAMPVALG